MLQAVDNSRNAPRQGNAGVGHAVPHCVAGADFNWNTGFLRHLHQGVCKRYDKAVEVRTGNILKMATWTKPGFNCISHYGKVVLHRLFTGHFKLVENMVVGTADQNPRFTDSNVFDQLEIFLAGPDPGCDFRELITQIHTALKGFTVLFAVDKKFCLADNPLWAAQAVHHFINIDHLLHGIGRAGLLPVAEGCIGNPDILLHVHGDTPVIKRGFGNFVVRVHVPKQTGLRHIL